MFKKVLFILYILVFVAVVYFAFTVFLSRENDVISPNTDSPKKQEVSSSIQDTPTEKTESIVDTIPKDQIDNTTQPSNDEAMPLSGNAPSEKQNNYIEIAPLDCTQDCAPYKSKEKDFEYCQNICGLTQSPTNTDNCDSQKNLKKDYCLKDMAISKKDGSLCDQISDSNVKNLCKNRIQEDILDNI